MPSKAARYHDDRPHTALPSPGLSLPTSHKYHFHWHVCSNLTCHRMDPQEYEYVLERLRCVKESNVQYFDSRQEEPDNERLDEVGLLNKIQGIVSSIFSYPNMREIPKRPYRNSSLLSQEIPHCPGRNPTGLLLSCGSKSYFYD